MGLGTESNLGTECIQSAMADAGPEGGYPIPEIGLAPGPAATHGLIGREPGDGPDGTVSSRLGVDVEYRALIEIDIRLRPHSPGSRGGRVQTYAQDAARDIELFIGQPSLLSARHFHQRIAYGQTEVIGQRSAAADGHHTAAILQELLQLRYGLLRRYASEMRTPPGRDAFRIRHPSAETGALTGRLDSARNEDDHIVFIAETAGVYRRGINDIEWEIVSLHNKPQPAGRDRTSISIPDRDAGGTYSDRTRGAMAADVEITVRRATVDGLPCFQQAIDLGE